MEKTPDLLLAIAKRKFIKVYLELMDDKKAIFSGKIKNPHAISKHHLKNHPNRNYSDYI